MFKRTPFYEKHIEAGGKIVEFAGFEMPIQFRGIIHEVNRVRTTVGVFDVSHMGRIEVSGKGALEFVSKITTNDPTKLSTFQAQYTCMCYENGGIVDDLIVYNLQDKFLLVINGANRDKDYKWLLQCRDDFKSCLQNVIIKNVSDKVAQLAIQGPQAEPTLQPIVDIDLSNIKYYWGAKCKIDGVDTFISRTGYTGEDGFELYFDSKYANKIWNKVESTGKQYEIEPIGLGARDVLRLEMKYCLYGNDIDKTTSPLEAGLGWITKLDKPNFIGKSALIKQKQEGVKRRLVAFIMKSKAIPRQHYHIYALQSNVGVQNLEPLPVGEVTSGNFSPSINQPIGLGYVNLPYDKEDTEIMIDCRGKLEPAKIINPPFYKHASHK